MTNWPWNPDQPEPPTPPATDPVKYCRVSVFAAAGGLAPLVGGTLRFDDPSWDILIAEIEGGRLKFTLPKPAQYGWQVHLQAHTADQDGTWDKVLAPDIDVALGPARPPTRTGVVTLVGKSWTDAGGPYYPLGDTLFYALGHWHRGGQLRELAQENIAFIGSYRHDYFRMLGEVDWANDQDINPQWPGYEQDLAELVDFAYDVHGLRVKVTVSGGGSDWRLAAQKIANVVSVGRHHKVQLIESANETNQSAAVCIEMVGLFRSLGVLTSVGRGNSGIDNIKLDGDIAKAHVDCFHTERAYGDDTEPGGRHARQVRQARDFIKFDRAAGDTEPPGPASSGQQLDDPYMIATKRAADIVQGGEMFCVHTGAGVYGYSRDTVYGHRPARLADVPQMDAIMRATRNADLHIPKGCGNWEKFNSNQPIAHIAGNANKLFGCKSGNKVVEVLIGCDNGDQVFKVSSAMMVDVYNIATGESVGHHELAVLQSFQQSGLWAYLLIGETR